jgi:DNA replication initiation complex subunit (GINS family)
MVNKTIENLENKIQKSNNLDNKQKLELTQLISKLKSEIIDIYETNYEKAKSITNFTESSTHEAIRDDKDKELFDLSVEGLQKSVKSFEESHPKLVETVNSICTALSNAGF